jgi:hypothetical protein
MVKLEIDPTVKRLWLRFRTAALKLWFWRQLRHTGVDANGQIYVRDPQSGAIHKVAFGADGKLVVESKVEQKKRAKFVRNAKRAIRGF